MFVAWLWPLVAPCLMVLGLIALLECLTSAPMTLVLGLYRHYRRRADEDTATHEGGDGQGRTMYGLHHRFLNVDVAPSSTTHYLNMGAWRGARGEDATPVLGFVAANRRLIDRVARAAQLQDRRAPNATFVTLLDIGYGCGDPSVYLATRYAIDTLVGVTLEASHARLARQKVAAYLARHPGPRRTTMRLVCGDAAEAIPDAVGAHAMGRLDVAVCIDAAYHFPRRGRVYRDAWRALRPGGRLVLTDLHVHLPDTGRVAAVTRGCVRWALGRVLGVPWANVDTTPLGASPGEAAQRYEARVLAASGFGDVQVQCLDTLPVGCGTLGGDGKDQVHVFEGLRGHVKAQVQAWERFMEMPWYALAPALWQYRLMAWCMDRVMGQGHTGVDRHWRVSFVLVSARKPT